MDEKEVCVGEESVFVILRNPHSQGVANVQEAFVVPHPENPGEKSLYLYDTYYPYTEEVAVYTSAFEADRAFREAFGIPEEESYHG
ncbi:transcriptional regulator SplA domain-containing protein [Jeotgalibacillus sp. ET6]|uniref:transcriptional regulator SplA domain-containing protein n=1 Tax=Jeotgalibacillus sp. ET6 TaxID=3037260 RepID=UPI002418875C|nr:transcriptional regulator SplA domain-containing protein [Jeotgalibacillus sp. ET6]MDG5471518.1 transcriptional regulator SplA domain-containing protein [Jeotgalibacillus sp. ET6]